MKYKLRAVEHIEVSNKFPWQLLIKKLIDNKQKQKSFRSKYPYTQIPDNNTCATLTLWERT